VDLGLPADDLALLQSLGEDLRFVLITSAARIAPATELTVKVSASAHQKCERCWHYREDVGSVSAHPTICGRCDGNLHGAGENRTVA
jgi:isoleucyl-tRNA synthetase